MVFSSAIFLFLFLTAVILVYYGLLRRRAGYLHGIVNGLDTELYNPATDKYLTEPFMKYDATNVTEKKIDNKAALQRMLDLPVERQTPLVAMVTRLVEPKGIERSEGKAKRVIDNRKL